MQYLSQRAINGSGSVSLDHLVGEREQIRRQFKADRFRGLQVDHKQIFGRLLERQIGGLSTLENPIDQGGGAFEGIL